MTQATPQSFRNGRKPRPVATPVAGPDSPFWDCRISAFEWVLLVLVVAMALALHLGPVLHSSLGIPLIYAIAAVSYLSPVTGFVFIAASQFLPFPEGSPHNPAQAGVLVWLPMILLRYQGIRLGGISRLWPVFPWLLWLFLMTGQQIYLPSSDYMKVLVYAVIACQMANESKGKYLKCLLGLCLGTLLVMCAYWGSQLGLPIEINDWGNDREGETRMGGVRADAVMVWPALLMGVSGLLGIQITLASPQSPRPSPRWLTFGSLFLFVFSIPPLVSTMSHGAFAGLFLVIIALALAIWKAAQAGAFASPHFRRFIGVLGWSVVAIFVLFAVDAFDLRTKAMKLHDYYQTVSQSSSLAASRTGVWHDAVHTIITHPLFGLRQGEQEQITSEYADAGGYLSHNVFLDYGRYTGLPGMLLVVFFFFYPAFCMWQTGNVMRYMPFLLAHFAMLIFWMSLSFQFYKTFWALWMLMAVTIAHHPVPQRHRTRPAPKTAVRPPAAVPAIVS